MGYYDPETGLYSLQSRYYDPELGRFINGDGVINGNGDILGYNIFAYCSNNPIMRIDPTGYHWWDDLCAGISTFINDFISDYQILLNETAHSSVVSTPNSVAGGTLDTETSVFSKKYTNRPDSGLIGVPDEEISQKARDKSLPGDVRRKYQEEEKIRGLRNQQKRANREMLLEPTEGLGTSILIGGASVATGYAIYRVVRMIPSLFPPLWWTLPANVACP